MSTNELRRAAATLRERAHAATPGKWIGFGQAIGVTVKGCTCAGPIPGYPQHESYCGTDGPIVDATEPDIAYIATVQPEVGLEIADLLDMLADDHDAADLDGRTFDLGAMSVARLINGGAS